MAYEEEYGDNVYAMGGEGVSPAVDEGSPYDVSPAAFAPPARQAAPADAGWSRLPNGVYVRDAANPPGEGMPGRDAGNALAQRTNAYLQQMSNQPLSHAERMQLLRLQNGLAQVQQRIFSGEYTPQEGRDMEMLLHTGIDPLHRRQQMAQLAQVQQHTQLEATRAAHLLVQGQEAEKFRAANVADIVFTMEHPRTHEPVPGLYYRNHHGDILAVPGTERAERDPVTPQMEETLRNRMTREVDHELRDNPANPRVRGSTATQSPTAAAIFRRYDNVVANGIVQPVDREESRRLEIDRRLQLELDRLRGARTGASGGRPSASSPAPAEPPQPQVTRAQAQAFQDLMGQLLQPRQRPQPRQAPPLEVAPPQSSADVPL